MSDVTRTLIPSDLLPVDVKGTILYTDTDPSTLKSVLRFFKLLSSPVEDGPGHKAHRTKTLKGIISTVEKSDDTTDGPRLVTAMESILNPSKTVSAVDVDDEFTSLMDGLANLKSDDVTPDDVTPDADPS